MRTVKIAVKLGMASGFVIALGVIFAVQNETGSPLRDLTVTTCCFVLTTILITAGVGTMEPQPDFFPGIFGVFVLNPMLLAIPFWVLCYLFHVTTQFGVMQWLLLWWAVGFAAEILEAAYHYYIA